MELNQELWSFIQKHLGYSAAELEQFKSNPSNFPVLEKAAALSQKTIVFEVTESHGCNSRHQAGEQFLFDGAGNLITKRNPSRVCIFALHSMAALIYGAQELFYAGVDPNQACFKRVGCHDVGVRCGGWGHIVMEIRMEDRQRG